MVKNENAVPQLRYDTSGPWSKKALAEYVAFGAVMGALMFGFESLVEKRTLRTANASLLAEWESGNL